MSCTHTHTTGLECVCVLVILIDYEMRLCISSLSRRKELKIPRTLCLDNKSCFLCPFQSLSVLDDSNHSSPPSDLCGLVVEPNLSGRSHTLTFSSSEVSADQTFICMAFLWRVKGPLEGQVLSRSPSLVEFLR